MELTQRMELFSQLLVCGGDVYTWCYDSEGKLISSNCPDETTLHTAFVVFGCKQKMLEYAAEHTLPVTLGTSFGALWNAAFERENGLLKHIWVIGPVFYRDVSLRTIENGLQQYGKMNISVEWSMKFYKAAQKIPVLQSTLLSRYTVMLHYCLTGQRLQTSDLNSEGLVEVRPTANRRDRHKVWMAEQAMMQMVRTGDLNYRQALSAGMGISPGVPVDSPDALRQNKISVIVFVTITCRAAIEGGLSPEEAYSLGDSYIQAAESAKSITEIEPLGNMMYDDFIRRVHRHRTNPDLSTPIQRCCDYIEMHLDEKLQAKDLADLAGYAEYYFTHKFKEETGLSLANYIKFAKIERAKVLLANTTLSVQEISEQLSFGTRNYFSHIFLEIVGCSPMEFRRKNGTV